ncbi:CENPK protein, partial [Zapornia atra]|nr:CENPK protein [Zapornia atra]
QLSVLMMRVKGLLEEHNRWQKKRPEVVSSSPDVLLALGQEELQKVKSDLEMLLSTLQSKNKRLEEDLKREQQWYKEQEQILYILNKIEEEAKKQVNHCSNKSLTKASLELKNKTLRVNFFKEHLLNDLCGFLEEHFPLPEKGGIAEKKKKCNENPSVELVTLQEIVEILTDKIISTPHEPYVAIRESFWPPYIEMLLRSGIALRHPEDPNRIRLEAFH